MQNIEQITLNFLEKYSLTNLNKTFIIGFSGGIDSLCLLHILNNLSKTHNFKLQACHLNHNWRGAESLKEQKIAEEFCRQKKINFYSETLPEGLPQTELEAREQRYKFFENCCEKFNADGIFTAHTLTDKTETTLYRIIKGTGINGLKSIPELRLLNNKYPIYRPILDITREDTTEYCNINHLTPSMDSSNFDKKYLRNKIRLSIVPELKKINPNLDKALHQLNSIADDSEAIINEYITKIKENLFDDEEIKTQKFLELSIPAKKKILLDYLIENNLDYSYEKIEELLFFIQEACLLTSGNTLSLTTDKWLFVSKNVIKIIFSTRADVVKSQVSVNLDGETFFEELGKTLIIKKWNNQKLTFPKETEPKAFVDLSNIDEQLFLRTRCKGDVIQPFGMNEKTKLKKYLINKGIPEHERDAIPLLATNKEVLWVAGVGISEKLRVKNTPTHIIEII